ncbi:DUF397 domain-containing protein [Streptomyces antimycoticus]|uniref:DUF397 domain-containing protein n=1 Tax=Streptomyces antimycoticus TaxID=68175 RepID=A0A4D4KGB5_9ACTN|nr:DUF397 domain-containing protein [Streptomyces antimycoticus]BBJ41507.1 hypothetical protein SSPO_042250 [Streptomyces antimycoticus]GDY44933.1 hypothetical protein SANT12839_058150 [Streptomyces antimycoticus]
MSTIPDLSGVEWVKSSYSGNGGGSCVEWAPKTATVVRVVPVRDSKNPNGPTLVFPPSSWASFISAVRGGEFHGA